MFVEPVVAGLEDPIDAAFARSFVVDTSSDKVGPEMVDRLVDELLKVPTCDDAFRRAQGVF